MVVVDILLPPATVVVTVPADVVAVVDDRETGLVAGTGNVPVVLTALCVTNAVACVVTSVDLVVVAAVVVALLATTFKQERKSSDIWCLSHQVIIGIGTSSYSGLKQKWR